MTQHLILALPLLLVASAACSEFSAAGPRQSNVDQPRQISTSPDYWQSDVTSDDGTFVVTDSIRIRDTLENARTELYEQVLRRAVELTVKDLLRDETLYPERENELVRLLVGQFQKFVVSHRVLQERRLGDGTELGLKVRVEVARQKVAHTLQTEGLQRFRMKTILVVRKPDGDDPEVAAMSHYLANIAEDLSRELLDRGFPTQLWRDVRLRLAEDREAGDDEALEDLLTRFVEESRWRNPEDERYQLPLILLRSRGRLLVGFQILEFTKRGLAYHVTMRIDAYDLLNGRSLGYQVVSDRQVIAQNQTLREAREVLVKRAAGELIGKQLESLREYVASQARLETHDYTFVFQDFGQRDINRIATLMAGILAEDIDAEVIGGELVVEAKVARKPIPLRDEIQRNLKRLGLDAAPPTWSGNRTTFRKEL